MTNELLPCPFCGSAAKIETLLNVFYVKCDDTCCSSAYYHTKEAAIKAWNTRHAPICGDDIREIAIGAMYDAYNTAPPDINETITSTREIWLRFQAEHYVDKILEAIRPYIRTKQPGVSEALADIQLIRNTAGDIDIGYFNSGKHMRGNIGCVVSRACDRLEAALQSRGDEK